MSHTDWIWIISTATFASTIGVYVLIRKIKQYTRPEENVLTGWNHDIELQYIEPIQSNARDIDISSIPQYPTSQAVINQLPIRWSNPPRYSEITNYYINSPLEFNIFFPLEVLFNLMTNFNEFILLTINSLS